MVLCLIRNQWPALWQRGFESSVLRCGSSINGNAPDCDSGMMRIQFPSVAPLEGIRLDEELVLKTCELNRFGGSSPSPSATNDLQTGMYKVIIIPLEGDAL